MNEVQQYVLRSAANEIVFAEPGLIGLKKAVNRGVNGFGLQAGIVERGPTTTSYDDWQGTIVAVVSHRPLLGLGERGHAFITREMTSVERVYINHFSDKLAWLDLSQVRVDYAWRCSDLKTTSKFKRGLGGLEAAIRGVRTDGWGLIMRRIEGIPGEQCIAVFAATGHFYTKSADESERTLIQTVRGAMEWYGEFPHVLPLDEPESRDLILAALALARDHEDDALAQASAFHNLMGRFCHAMSTAATVLGLASTMTGCFA